MLIRGRAEMQLKNLNGALEDFAKAEYHQAKAHEENSHYDGNYRMKYERAKIASLQMRLEEAADTMELLCDGIPAHSRIGATHHRKGCVLILGSDTGGGYQFFRNVEDVGADDTGDTDTAGTWIFTIPGLIHDLVEPMLRCLSSIRCGFI
ncbi:hypothetical protein GGR53DRAFT_471420 [Hypoxylon sp. FL1150]|nr:hypothetical protein GGR53DRAFT_471420 [Hypoxylon sp. FL1150]